MQLLFSTQSWNYTIAWRKTSTWKYQMSFPGTGNYSAAVVSVQGTGIPLQPRGSQIPGVVKPVLLGQDFQCSCCSLYRAGIMLQSGRKLVPRNVHTGNWNSTTAYRKPNTWSCPTSSSKTGLQCSCCFCTSRWNSATSWRKPNT